MSGSSALGFKNTCAQQSWAWSFLQSSSILAQSAGLLLLLKACEACSRNGINPNLWKLPQARK